MAKVNWNKVLELLEGGRETLNRTGVWCKGSLASTKDANGYKNFVGERELFDILKTGQEFKGQVCAIGALAVQPGCLRAVKSTAYNSYKGYAIKWAPAGLAAERELDKVVKDKYPKLYAEGEVTCVVDLNDRNATRRKGEILDIYDAAIENVKDKLAA